MQNPFIPCGNNISISMYDMSVVSNMNFEQEMVEVSNTLLILISSIFGNQIKYRYCEKYL